MKQATYEEIALKHTKSQIVELYLEIIKTPTFDELVSEFKSLHLFENITHEGICINIWKGNTRLIEVMSHKVTYLEPFGKVGLPFHNFLSSCMKYLQTQKEKENV